MTRTLPFQVWPSANTTSSNKTDSDPTWPLDGMHGRARRLQYRGHWHVSGCTFPPTIEEAPLSRGMAMPPDESRPYDCERMMRLGHEPEGYDFTGR